MRTAWEMERRRTGAGRDEVQLYRGAKAGQGAGRVKFEIQMGEVRNDYSHCFDSYRKTQKRLILSHRGSI